MSDAAGTDADGFALDAEGTVSDTDGPVHDSDPDPEEVRTALAQLATDPRSRPGGAPGPAVDAAGTAAARGRPPAEQSGTATRTDLRPDHVATVVDVAAGVTGDLDAAASFAAAGGVELLALAIDTAVERGDVAVARRGQRALAAFEWVRRAASETDCPDSEESGDTPATTSTPVTEPL